MTTDFLFDGPAQAPLTLVLAHGAGAAMDTPFMTDVARGVAAAAYRVARFEFPYMAARRTTGTRRGPDREPVLLDAWRTAVAELGDAKRIVIGGKSMGGRMASMVADELGVAGLVCLGYPFHPPGQPAKLRVAHLAELRTPTLIVQGERDAFGPRAEVEDYHLSPAIRFHWLPDGDHSFVPRGSSGRNARQNIDDAVAAVNAFLGGLTRR